VFSNSPPSCGGWRRTEPRPLHFWSNPFESYTIESGGCQEVGASREATHCLAVFGDQLSERSRAGFCPACGHRSESRICERCGVPRYWSDSTWRSLAFVAAAVTFFFASRAPAASRGMEIASAVVVGACLYLLFVEFPIGSTPPFRPGAVLRNRPFLIQAALLGAAIGSAAAPQAIERGDSSWNMLANFVAAIVVATAGMTALIGLVLLVPRRLRRYLLTHNLRTGAIVRICPHCAQHVSANALHCGNCGRSVHSLGR
jgi:hypothetical protein